MDSHVTAKQGFTLTTPKNVVMDGHVTAKYGSRLTIPTRWDGE